MRELAQQGYLAYDVARHPALGRRIGVRYALYCDGAVRGALRAAVDGAVCSLSDEVGAGVRRSIPTKRGKWGGECVR